MKGKFPASIPDWSNINVIHRNVLPPRSYFFLYNDERDALAADIQHSRSVRLSGTWKFQHSSSPFEAPEGFEQPGFDTSQWSDIQVPGHWQLQGWAKPHYTNVVYPFFVDPPYPPYDKNQTGSYVRSFTVPDNFEGEQLRLRFEGVDSAFHVFVNGKEVGYSQGSRNASEFDITSFVTHRAENVLAVRVYQFCDGSYLEDQDQWWLSGIFRDVYLHAFPQNHIQDVHLQTDLDDEYVDADLRVKVDVQGQGSVTVKLFDASGRVVTSGSATVPLTSPSTSITLALEDPWKWSAESPCLYKAAIAFEGRCVVQNVGFRRIEIKDGILQVNGKRIVFRGVNRHEHHPLHGRAVPYEFMRNDLLLMKQHNINALRTSHQPSDPRLYDLADELGLWIMDEADVECHGFSTIDEMALPHPEKNWSFERKKALVHHKSARFTSDNAEWEEQYVDRAIQLCARDKNHPSVVMWSLGNEAFYGCNFQSMYDAIKAVDSTRPVHYEGDFEAKTADVYSQMYPAIEDVIKFAQEPTFEKPLVLCEFVHAMGCGPGNIAEYIAAFYEHRRLQGGWVWEWCNHGLTTVSDQGEEHFAYGGDFDDVPNDGNFILDGVVFSNHTPSPGLTEYKKAIEPVQVLGFESGQVEIVNRYDSITLDHLECKALLVTDGRRAFIARPEIPLNVQPHRTVKLVLQDLVVSEVQTEAYLQLDFALKEATRWAEAGHVVATSQLRLHGPVSRSPSSSPSTSVHSMLSAIQRSTLLYISGTQCSWTFNLVTGRISSWKKQEVEFIADNGGPDMSFYRARTDNDRPQDGRDWIEKKLHLTKPYTRDVDWHETEHTGAVVVQVSSRVGPPSLSWSIDSVTTYTFYPSGQVRLHCTGVPQGMNLPETLARIGLTFSMPAGFDVVSWFGRGPGQSYKDMKLSQHWGNHESTVHDLWVDYEFPQESSNRTDIRWVRFSKTSSSSPSMVSSAITATASAVKQIPFIGGALPATASSAVATAAGVMSRLKLSGEDSIAASTTASMKVAGDVGPSLTARFGAQEGFSFMVSHYTTTDIDESRHPYELRRRREKHDQVIVRLDADHHGLGSGSCGPKTRDEYALKTRPFEFEIEFE